MQIVRVASVVLSLCLPTFAFAADPAPTKAPEKTTEASATCEQHGVKKSVCTRCNPKLEAVFKAKGDWCAEHNRPESQCALCNPELAKKGVK